MRLEKNIKKFLAELRTLISRHAADIPEKDLLVALVEESAGWEMRLEELEDDDGE